MASPGGGNARPGSGGNARPGGGGNGRPGGAGGNGPAGGTPRSMSPPVTLPTPQPPAPPPPIPQPQPPPPPVNLQLPLPPPTFTLPGGSGGGAGAAAAAAAAAAGFAFGQQINDWWEDVNSSPINGPAWPGDYPSNLVPVSPPTSIGGSPVVGWQLEGLWTDGDDTDYFFADEVGPNFTISIRSVPHPDGGSNGVGSVLTLDSEGKIVGGRPLYSSNCTSAKCGLLKWKLTKLIPKFADGTTGPDQSTPESFTDSNPRGADFPPLGLPDPTVYPPSPSQAPGQANGPGKKSKPSSPPLGMPTPGSPSPSVAPGPEVGPGPGTEPAAGPGTGSGTSTGPAAGPGSKTNKPPGVYANPDGTFTFITPGGVPGPVVITPPGTTTTPPGGATAKAPPGSTVIDLPGGGKVSIPNLLPLIPAIALAPTPTGTQAPPNSPPPPPGTGGPCSGNGCLGSISAGVAANTAGQVNNNAATNYWGGLNAGMNTAQLTQLNSLQAGQATILTRLGPQAPGAGGISGFLGRFFGAFEKLGKWLGIDRLINMLVLISVLHNAYMLSGSLKATLLEMISSLGNSTGVLEDKDGENIDLNKLYDEGVEALFKKLLGEKTLTGIKATWKKYNRIYQAAASILGSVQSMINGLANVIEATAEYTGKIGNSLKAAGAIAENAFQWMPEQLSARTGKLAAVQKFGTTVSETSELFDNVTEASEEVVEFSTQVKELNKQNTEFKKAVKESGLNPGIENDKVKALKDKEKANATKPTTGADETALVSVND